MVDKKMSKQLKKRVSSIIIFLALVVFTLNLSIFNLAYNYEYINVTSKVNVTNAYPMITSITVDNQAPSGLILNAGSLKYVSCNLSITDWNGYADIKNVTAVLWNNNTVAYDDADNFDHYTNNSCLNLSQDSYYANYTCTFPVVYYANNGTNWLCNATVYDNYEFSDWDINTTSIAPLWALNVTPIIDFGDMAVGDTKNNITSNITNFGNMAINVSVNGYGETPGDGLAMKCAIRNITISNLKFSINASEDWTTKTALSTNLKNITGLTVPKRTAGLEWNTTYWDLYIPPSENPFGLCNGTVIFTAVAG